MELNPSKSIDSNSCLTLDILLFKDVFDFLKEESKSKLTGIDFPLVDKATVAYIICLTKGSSHTGCLKYIKLTEIEKATKKPP